MRNPFARRMRAPEELTVEPFRLHTDPADREFTPQEPTVEQVRDAWRALYIEQSATMEQLVAALDAQKAIVDQARHFMAVLGQRMPGGETLFLINQQALPGEADTLRHAVVTLQAMLAGTELPAFVAVDRITH